jgi:hypothetical protein
MIKYMVVIRCYCDLTLLDSIGLDIDKTVKYAWLAEPLRKIINPQECCNQRTKT